LQAFEAVIDGVLRQQDGVAFGQERVRHHSDQRVCRVRQVAGWVEAESIGG
jgi:hypothetical protein